MRQSALGIIVMLGLAGLADQSAQSDDSELRDIPAALAPLEYLVGSWKGQGRPREKTANQFRGWEETHNWAWIFVKGKPVGLSVTIEGGKIVADGKLRFDPERKRYRLEASSLLPSGRRVAFEGTLDSTGKLLILDETPADDKYSRLRISLRPNANFIRYTMMVDRQKPSEVQFSPVVEVGLTRKGESLAGGATTAEGPKCIVTGGAASMTLTYQGRTFPICCTGCRDEFNDNPEKYIKKASLILSTQAAKPKSEQAPSSGVSRSEDEFASDVSASATAGRMTGQAKSTTGGTTVKAEKAGPARPAADDESPKVKTSKSASKPAAAKAPNRAAGLLRIAQNLEKIGKTDEALNDFRQIVKDYPGTPAAKTAAARIKALKGP